MSDNKENMELRKKHSDTIIKMHKLLKRYFDQINPNLEFNLKVFQNAQYPEEANFRLFMRTNNNDDFKPLDEDTAAKLAGSFGGPAYSSALIRGKATLADLQKVFLSREDDYFSANPEKKLREENRTKNFMENEKLQKLIEQSFQQNLPENYRVEVRFFGNNLASSDKVVPPKARQLEEVNIQIELAISPPVNDIDAKKIEEQVKAILTKLKIAEPDNIRSDLGLGQVGDELFISYTMPGKAFLPTVAPAAPPPPFPATKKA